MTFSAHGSRIVVTRTADAALERLGVAGDHRARRRAVIASAYGGLSPIGDSLEQSFVSLAEVDGEPVALLCCATGGALIIRGVLSPQSAEDLLAIGRGLSPLINQCRNPARKVADDRSEACDV